MWGKRKNWPPGKMLLWWEGAPSWPMVEYIYFYIGVHLKQACPGYGPQTRQLMKVARARPVSENTFLVAATRCWIKHADFAIFSLHSAVLPRSQRDGGGAWVRSPRCWPEGLFTVFILFSFLLIIECIIINKLLIFTHLLVEPCDSGMLPTCICPSWLAHL